MASVGNRNVYDPQLDQIVSLEAKQYIYSQVGAGTENDAIRPDFADSLIGKANCWEFDAVNGCVNVAVYPPDHVTLAISPGEFNG